MSVKVDVNYARTVECNRSLAETYAYCANLESSLPACFPGVERFELVEPQVYRWLFEKISYSGHNLQLKLTTRFKKLEPSRIEMSPAGEPSSAQITGHWGFAEAGGKTNLEFRVLLQLDLPIPFFLKAMAAPIAQKELSKLFDRYLSNVEKLFHNRAYCGTLAGLVLVLAFAPINLFPLVLLAPCLLNVITLRTPSFWVGFRSGFLCSLAIMLGSFYWVVYVIHVFGYLPWSVSALLFVGFCGFGALNFPIFVGLASWIHQKHSPLERSPRFIAIWFSVGLPALYTLVEFLVPKLFPWYLGHFYYKVPLLTQIVELTGCSYLSFITYSLGSVIGLWWLARTENLPFWKPVWAIPLALWAVDLGFSAYRLLTPPLPSRPFTVGLIQASIGSLEKVAARHGLYAQVQYVLSRYETLSEQSLNSDPKPDLLVWPETAVPFQLDSPGHFAQEVRDAVLRWNTPLLTGAYAPVPFNPRRDYNAAYLLEPQPSSHTLHMEMRPKNILLAFGEYMPFGDIFPSLYREFPEVSDFERGTTQEPIVLQDGTRLGITICYEAIVPEFFRKVAAKHVQAVINLTNDSWFGPTSEPYQHGALTVFRAIEYRVPLVRVTNTGISFTVDSYGRMSRHSGVYVEDVLNQTIQIPLTPPETVYLKLGEWFNLLSAMVLAWLVASLIRKKEKNVPLPV